MSQHLLEVALSTLTVCLIVTLFSLATARFWSWFFKIDMFLFWLSAISRKLDKNNVQYSEGKSKWKEMYKQLLTDRRQN